MSDLLLQIASSVEAAVEAYVSVRDLGKADVWREKFWEENENALRGARLVLAENGDVTFPLHPVLVGLQIVLDQKEDLGNITRSHPNRALHMFYDEKAEFDLDISHMLPPIADRWWEQLAEDAHREHAAQNPPDEPRPPIQDTKKGESLKLIIPPRRQDKMVVGEEQPQELEVSSRGRPKAGKAKTAAGTKKGKGSSAGRGRKRGAQSKPPAPAEKTSGRSSSRSEPDFECDRCIKSGVRCVNDPTGPCKLCSTKKVKCSLMPLNPETGKTSRRAMTEAEIRQFRVGQVAARAETVRAEAVHAEAAHTEAARAEVKRGKRRARESPDADDREGSSLAPLPQATLVGLARLSLGPRNPSPARTPADSPAALPRPPLPENPAPAPLSASKPRKRSKPSPSPTAPIASQFLNPARSQASHSPSSISPNDGTNLSQAARIDMLEARQREMEKMLRDFGERLAKLGG